MGRSFDLTLARPLAPLARMPCRTEFLRWVSLSPDIRSSVQSSYAARWHGCHAALSFCGGLVCHPTFGQACKAAMLPVGTVAMPPLPRRHSRYAAGSSSGGLQKMPARCHGGQDAGSLCEGLPLLPDRRWSVHSSFAAVATEGRTH